MLFAGAPPHAKLNTAIAKTISTRIKDDVPLLNLPKNPCSNGNVRKYIRATRDVKAHANDQPALHRKIAKVFPTLALNWRETLTLDIPRPAKGPYRR